MNLATTTAILMTTTVLCAGPWSARAGAQGHEGHGAPPQKPPAPAHEHAPAEKPPPTELPPITDDDRAAAFPVLQEQHAVHDEAVHSYVLLDQLEWQAGDGANGLLWDGKGWIGRDVSRFWFRTEGEKSAGDPGSGELHALYGRVIGRWWDAVAGVRQDVRPGPNRTWLAVGVQGLAPYWFEVEATAYLGAAGRTQFRFETEYELLLTNRLVLQPLIEIDVYGKSDRELGVGAGLSSIDAGLRLRYEIRREFAPYAGVTWERKFFGTADLAKEEGHAASDARFALGLRVWF